MEVRRAAVDGPSSSVYHQVYTLSRRSRVVKSIKKTKLFMSGNSQAVRIPRDFQMKGDEVEIQRRGNTLIIRPPKPTWQPLMDGLTMFTSDFMEEGRTQPPTQKRKRTFA